MILAALSGAWIGMMKAMGLEMKELIYVFVIESTGIGILGGTWVCLVLSKRLLANIGVDFASI